MRDTRNRTQKESYLQSLIELPHEAFQDVEKLLRADEKWGINVSALEGRLLEILVRLHRPRKIVEIGTLYGYSTLWLAEGLSEDGHVWTLEKEESHARRARQTFEQYGAADRISVLVGDALELLPSLVNKGPFDLIFIDANKGGYIDYLNWAENNLRDGGLLIADNTLLFDTVWRDEPGEGAPKNPWMKMKAFNERLKDRSRWISVLLPTSEGLSLAIRV